MIRMGLITVTVCNKEEVSTFCTQREGEIESEWYYDGGIVQVLIASPDQFYCEKGTENE